ncbi:hypothetical protein EFL95_05165 [Nocardioides marmorisolisilvae]|uniref:CSD domain-containing protein n=2 Tax=Nocardioides marmorisolisilvae TaxID=1542737 RepID=A0A3N0DS80_9ACTN|nr:hypothetical protein EFL95_05165 [Nocardioides marmorisolisilvae]
MHFKPLLPDDLDRLLAALGEATAHGVPLPNVARISKAIHQDPDWSPSIPQHHLTDVARTLHNLPLPEYDETGLLGRRGDINRLRKLLTDARYPAITVLGPGGIGKTALAVQTLYDLADDPACPFDAILWTSLKTERLTASGIAQLRAPLTSFAEIVREIAEPLEEDFAGTIADLADVLEGLTVLLCVDNLETASGDEAIQLIEALPASTRFLFTSRVGLGQIERTLPIGPLDESYAVDLLRRTARARDLEALYAMQPEQATKVVRRLACNPLAIRWFVLSVEAGQRPEAILENQDDLLRFCVANVWDALTDEEREVAQAIFQLEHPVTVQELSLYLDAGPDELRRDVHGLQRRALVRSVALTADIGEAFVVTDTAARYIARFGPADTSGETIERKQRLINASEERRRLDEGRAPLAPATVFVINEVDQPAALVLRDALHALRRLRRGPEGFETCLGMVDQAAELSPGYFEVERVRGFILANAGRSAAATVAYRRALEQAPDDLHRARVAHIFAGHLARNEGESAEALTHARFADQILDTVETSVQVAALHMFLGELDTAISMLEPLVATATGKPQRIAATQMMEARRRRAEILAREAASPRQAIEECCNAADLGASFLRVGISDTRMIETTAECIQEGLAIAVRATSRTKLRHVLDRLLALAIEHREALQYANSYAGIVQRASALLELEGADSPHRTRLVDLLDGQIDEGPQAAGTRSLGSIKDLTKGKPFGFISSALGDVFFHFTAVKPRNNLLFMKRGAAVAFNAEPGPRGMRATYVSLAPGTEADAAALKGRQVEVVKREPGRNFGFAVDSYTGLDVYLSARIFEDRRDWNSVSVGARLVVDLELDGTEKARALVRSATFDKRDASQRRPRRATRQRGNPK